MPKGIVYKAIPDSGLVQMRLSKDGRLIRILPNSMILSAGIQEALNPVTDTIFGPSNSPFPEDSQWVINTCADADEYSKGLDDLEQAVATMGIPVFNSAQGVRQTRRDQAFERLDGISGLTVPKCIRFKATEPSDFEQEFERHRFDYPVLVRLQCSQSGKNLVRIDCAGDWKKVHTISWPGRYIYMTEFVDCLHDGKYVKARVVVAGDTLSLRHLVASTNWVTSAGERTNQWSDHELQAIAAFDSWEGLQNVAREIGNRIELDFFGMDIGVVGNDLVFFEANAAMSILSTQHLPEYRREEYLEGIQAIERRVASAIDAKFLSGQTQAD